MIPFNKPPVIGTEIDYISKALSSNKLCGDGAFGKSCQNWFESKLGCFKALMVPSCTHALELAALLIDLQPGDEVIMPSYTFVSTANPFVLRGAKIIFVDIEPDTMNIDVSKIENAITTKTKAIVPVHYAGVSCDMDSLMSIANQYGLIVIEDAAQGMLSTYKNRHLGTIGHLAAFSFHETKNYTSGGEGGLILINDSRFIERAEIIREKGTNRSQFFRGMVDKYSWVDIGSSYLPSEIQSAYLQAQLDSSEVIFKRRMAIWNRYYDALTAKAGDNGWNLPVIPENVTHNAHMFYIKCRDIDERERFIGHLKHNGIIAVFHYIPLHSAKAGRLFSKFSGLDEHTTKESERLVRLPLFFNMTDDEVEHVISTVTNFN
ncbi:dTDP-4-amino-4,6-dideoxygalactose transaminase [Rheinheimera sp. MM224]|uniref:dTDP-4-amino-4,6-dideoxygalactose transaminase n=1 Tax=Rheinheimera sp. MM224 TaxID=3019969 RepID=UPI0021F91986|nr:dTDP-4-amino-4,6-dideoxygalactose transaminase [Rheinheimera sp. MM224]CAI3796497.1 dTDP-4-amino-4,6-dideoxygalactose transaminase [Rheinheimera sp. MM224]